MTRENFFGSYRVYVDDWNGWQHGIYVNIEYRKPGSRILSDPIWERTFYIKNDEYGKALAFNRSEENLIQYAEELQRQSIPTENIVIVTVQPNRFLLV